VTLSSLGPYLSLALSLPGTSHLTFSLYTLSDLETSAISLSLSCPLSLSPGEELSWMGFSDIFQPVTCDTEGIVRIFSRNDSGWVPFVELKKERKNTQECHWVTAVVQDKVHSIYIFIYIIKN
jgi:hypothetical protein